MIGVGFILFYIIQSMAGSIPYHANSESLDKNIVLKRVSFIVLIVCSSIAIVFSWRALDKKKNTLLYLVFIAELLFTTALIVFFLWSRTLFWM